MAQSDDGWDMADIGGVRTAYAQYSSGQTITIQCIANSLNVGFIGLPAAAQLSTDTSASHYRVTSTATGQVLSHAERIGNADSQVSKAILPARLARSMANGGQITISGAGAPDVVLDLPSDGTGIREIMTGCRTRATDPNDVRPLRALATTQIQARALRAGLSKLPNNPAPVTQITARCIVDADFKLKFCETARLIPDHSRAPVYSSIFNDVQVSPADGGTTPLAVGDMVVFNFVLTQQAARRPAQSSD